MHPSKVICFVAVSINSNLLQLDAVPGLEAKGLGSTSRVDRNFCKSMAAQSYKWFDPACFSVGHCSLQLDTQQAHREGRNLSHIQDEVAEAIHIDDRGLDSSFGPPRLTKIQVFGPDSWSDGSRTLARCQHSSDGSKDVSSVKCAGD